MKFYEFLKAVPDFWDNIKGYPTVVQSAVNEWFYYRTCCTNDTKKFTRFLGRELDLAQPQFNALWEAQTKIQFEPGTLEKVEQTINFVKDEGVTEAINRKLNGIVSDTGDTKTTTQDSGTDTTTTTNDLTNTTTDTGTQSRATDSTRTDNLTSTVNRAGTEKTDSTSTRTDNLKDITLRTGTEDRDINETRTDDLTEKNNSHKTAENGGSSNSTGNSTNTVLFSDYPQSSPSMADYLTTKTGETTDTTDTSSHTDNIDETTTGSRENSGTVNTLGSNNLTLDTREETTHSGTTSTEGSNTLTLNTDDTTINTGTQKNETTDTLTLDTTNTSKETGTQTSETAYGRKTDTTNTLNTTQTNDTTDETSRQNDINTKADTVINTLRTGNLEEAFIKYFELGTTFNSIGWLVGTLDKVFIQVYDYEDFCESDNSAVDDEIKKMQEQIRILQVEVDNVFKLAESVQDDVSTLDTEVTKQKEDIATVTQIATENSAELVTQNESITNLLEYKSIMFKGYHGGYFVPGKQLEYNNIVLYYKENNGVVVDAVIAYTASERGSENIDPDSTIRYSISFAPALLFTPVTEMPQELVEYLNDKFCMLNCDGIWYNQNENGSYNVHYGCERNRICYFLTDVQQATISTNGSNNAQANFSHGFYIPGVVSEEFSTVTGYPATIRKDVYSLRLTAREFGMYPQFEGKPLLYARFNSVSQPSSLETLELDSIDNGVTVNITNYEVE